MSRIGKKPITLPQGVTLTVDGQLVEVKGPKGTLSMTVHENMSVNIDESNVTVERPSETKQNKTLHGTTRALIQNMVVGVSEGYTKKLQMVGVGYRSAVQGKNIVVSAGYSQPVELTIPEGLTVEVVKNTEISISGIDKQLVGEFAANIRAIRKPEPYLGKGIRYVDEYVRRKEGKTAK
ncbi:MAG: 50S ribosomal protein L6 [Candidatus Izemoplasmataceae bacterium]|jgi:large subunit ribosomal protein L6|uniref:50S ribosomal protein L6 n=1 Tax=Liberiplasma polymorphum TaxID=3374570 RepID=UPI00377370BE